jgi:AcrR family transcriptional regulator
VSVEEAFAKVVGRQASDEERTRLYRLRDALGLRDNDAFWSIVMALEHYDSFFRAYPEKLAEETARSIENARAAFAVAAEKEAAQVQRVLSEKVAETSVQIARKLAERPVGIHRVTTALAAVVAFGALCASAGYSLGASEKPFWVTRDAGLRGAQRALSVVLALPAGWMIFALLLPVAGVGAKAGWTVATDGLVEWRERILGGCLVAACVAGCVASTVLLAKVL